MKCESTKHGLLILLLAALPALSSITTASAQDDPFRTSGDGATVPPASADETPDAKTKTDSAEEQDPFVRAVLEVKPTTSEQWLQDIQALLNLNRAELAKEYLTQFSASLPAASELAKLHARFGSAFFLRLSTVPTVQPEGAAVANAVMQAADERIRNTQRLIGLIDRLGSNDAAARRLAAAELVQAGAVAVPPLVSALGDDSRASQHAAVTATLAAIGEPAVDPLIATLDCDNSALRSQVIGLLGGVRSREAVPFLLAPALSTAGEASIHEAARKALQDILGAVPARDESMQFLARRLDSYLAGTLPRPVDEAGQVAIWMWDAPQGIPLLQTLPAADTAFVAAERIARQLYALAPEDADIKLMHLATSLEVAKRLAGYDRPLTEQTAPIVTETAAAGPAVLEELLSLALTRNMPGAALAAIDMLAESKDVELLRGTDGKPRLLARALLNSNRRVKFAAARAIMTIDPQSAYPGSSYLPEILSYLSTSGGRQRVIIGEPRAEVARTLAGFFDELGFDVDTQLVGREFVLQAFDSPDYAFALIGDAIDRPAYRDLVQTLRHDPRTADMPIGLMVREFNEESARWLTDTDPLTLVFAQPQTQQDVAFDTRRLLEAAGRRQVSVDERTREALFALDALAQLAEDRTRYAFYDVMRAEPRLQKALLIPNLAAKTARVLGLLGSPGAQQTLVDFASTQVLPLADRRAAADAFRAAVERRGLLLTRKQLQQQYDLYNASEILDQGSQEILASILDTIEAPTRETDPSKKDD